jgi:membrane protein YdbS with pleckstrin-like domain
MATDPELEVLMHESSQLHESIERLSGRVLGLFGVVLPGTLALFGLLAGASDQAPDPAVASVALVGVVAIVIVYATSIWGEVLTYIEYKYSVLYPDLYLKAGRDKANLLQEMARRPSRLTSTATALLILLFFVVTVGMAMLGIHSSEVTQKPIYFAAAIGLMVPPGITSFLLLRRVKALYANFSPRGKWKFGGEG